MARNCILALVVAGALTHFIGLSYPRQVVFDEVHWGKFVSAYCCTGERVFDVHPPHGKLLLTIGPLLGGYDGRFTFDHIGQPYEGVPVVFLRLVPALAGVLLAPLFFVFLKELGASVPAAFFGGALVVLDNALLLETHVLLFDGLLIAATFGSLVCLLRADRLQRSRQRLVWAAASGALAGLAVGIKFTGLAVVGIIGVHTLVSLVRRRETLAPVVLRVAIMSVAAVAIYLAGWAVHFALTPNPGLGDAFHPTTGRFIDDLIVAHRTMWAANVNLALTHPDASTPMTWPLMRVVPYFWAGTGASIYLVGNPVVWWGSAALLVGIAINSALMRVTRLRLETSVAKPAQQVWLPAAGYLIALLPFFGVRRVLFLYHYFTPLLLGLAVVVLWLDRAGWIRSDRLTEQRGSYYAVIAAAIAGFLLLSPLTYGYSFGNYDEWLADVIRSWR